MAKTRTRRRQPAAADGQVQAARPSIRTSDDGADQAVQLADAQARVVELTAQLARRVEDGARASRALQSLQSGSGGASAPSAPMTATPMSALTSESLSLTFLKQLSADQPIAATTLVEEQTKKAQAVVDFYSMIAAGVGLLPGMGLSFAGIFATQVLMVRDVAAAFGRDWTTSKTTVAVTALLGTGFSVGIGNGLKALTYSAFPSTVGNVLGVIANPVASYATSQAVGSVFISQFQNENAQEITKGLAASMTSFRAGARAA